MKFPGARFRFQLGRFGLVLAGSVFIGGCAGLSGLGLPTVALVFAATLLVGGGAACTQPTEEAKPDWRIGTDADARDADPPPDTSDAEDGGEGTWQTCCEDGRISTCFCPAGVICNYGRFTRCGGDRCVVGPRSRCPVDGGDTGVDDGGDTALDVSDARDVADTSGVRDASDTRDTNGRTCRGRWQQCCRNGVVDMCCCPPRTACNYGLFKRCGGNRCVGGFGRRDVGCPTDAGPG